MKRKNNKAAEGFGADEAFDDAFMYELEEFQPVIMGEEPKPTLAPKSSPEKPRKKKKPAVIKPETIPAEIAIIPEIPTVSDWGGMVLHQKIMQTLIRLGFNHPTPIQSRAIPPAIKKRNVFGSAETGSGKTLAYLIPVLNDVFTAMESLDYHATHSALLLLPNRELANQVHQLCQEFSKSLSYPFNQSLSCLIVGGMSEDKQLRQLNKNSAHVIISTPGRLAPLLSSGQISLVDVKYLIFDEVDKLLSLDGSELHYGELTAELNGLDLNSIQVMAYSATMKMKEIYNIMKKKLNLKLNNVEFISCQLEAPQVNSTNVNPANHSIKFYSIHSTSEDKDLTLLSLLSSSLSFHRLILFVESLLSIHHVAGIISNFKFKCIDSKMSQKRRFLAVEWFNSDDDDDDDDRILLTSSTSIRGLHFNHVNSIIHYDIAQSMSDWIHRIGRICHFPKGAQVEVKDYSSYSIVTPTQHSRHDEIMKSYQFEPHLLPPFSKQQVSFCNNLKLKNKLKNSKRRNDLELNWSKKVMKDLDVDVDEDASYDANDDDDDLPIGRQRQQPLQEEEEEVTRRKSRFIDVARDVYHIDHLGINAIKKARPATNLNEKMNDFEKAWKRRVGEKRKAKREKKTGRKESRKLKRST